MRPMLPIALRADGRPAVVVGGGGVAHRKVEALLAAGFAVRLVAAAVEPELRARLHALAHRVDERPYCGRDDLAGARLVVAATSDRTVNQRVVEDARALGILVCDATDPERGDFTMAAVHRVGELTVAVDSGGAAPALAKRLAREIGERFGDEYARAAGALGHARRYARAIENPRERAAVLRTLAAEPIHELAAMNPSDAEHAVDAAVERLRKPLPAPRTAQLVCASRASALAMTQTRSIAARLAQHGLATTILNVTTTGDRTLDRPIAASGVNVFVKELEVALRERRADYAVHSCKDLPSDLAGDMRIAAISARADARDVFCSERFATLEELPSGAVVGTSSRRREGALRALRPDLCYRAIRGNVDTRLRKLREGEYDAIVLAAAGLERLRLRATHCVPFALDTLVPAAAQGALAVETRADDAWLADEIARAVEHRDSAWCVLAERAALRALRLGCDAPVGVHAQLAGNRMTIVAAYYGTPGARRERTATVASAPDAEALGSALGAALASVIPAPERARHGFAVLPRTQTRPSRIAAALRAAGVDVAELHAGDAPDCIARLPDALLFPSSGAVRVAAGYLARLRDAAHRPVVIAMGARSGAAAQAAGFTPDAVAADASTEAFVRLVREHLPQ